MENLLVYHGSIGKEEGEKRLGQDGRDGCYLIRNSDSVPGVFCLCVLCKGIAYTYRLHRDEAGCWAAESESGVRKRYFRQIKNLIAAYKEPEQGIAMPLLYPVTAARRAQALREEEMSSNSLSLPGSGPNKTLYQRTSNPAAPGWGHAIRKKVPQAFGQSNF